MNKLPMNNQERYNNKAENIGINVNEQIEAMLLKLKELDAKYLFANSNKTSIEWYREQTRLTKGFNGDVIDLLNQSQKDIIKNLKSGAKAIEITGAAYNKERKIVQTTIKMVGEQAMQEHQKDIATIKIQSKAAVPLQKLISDRLTSKTPLFVEIPRRIRDDDGNVVKTIQTKMNVNNYLEMKVRTDFQHEVSENMNSVANKYNVVFAIASYYGDCAKDHQSYQGKIYYYKDWQKGFSDQKQIDEIQHYIDSNNLMSVEEVQGDGIWLTTRPNCRHYFQFMAVEDVLDITNEKSLNKYREANNLNWGGKYNEDKYKATQEQRYNEREIRKAKEEIINSEAYLNANPNDSGQQAVLDNARERLNYYRASQRNLIASNNAKWDDYGMERDAKREKTGNPSDLRLKVEKPKIEEIKVVEEVKHKNNEFIPPVESFKDSYSVNEEIAADIRSIVENAPSSSTKTILVKYLDRIKTNSKHQGGAYYSPSLDSIYVNVERELDEIKHHSGHRRGETIFHETGHMIVAKVSQDRGYSRFNDWSEMFTSEKYKKDYGDGVKSHIIRGHTLTSMLKEEFEDLKKSVKTQMQEEAVAKGLKKSDVKIKYVYDRIRDQIREESKIGEEKKNKFGSDATGWEVFSSISDILEGASNGNLETGFGHGKNYWKSFGVGVEAYAHLFSTSICNQKSYDLIKKYFPKSVEIFEELQEDILKGVK